MPTDTTTDCWPNCALAEPTAHSDAPVCSSPSMANTVGWLPGMPSMASSTVASNATCSPLEFALKSKLIACSPSRTALCCSALSPIPSPAEATDASDARSE